MDTNAHSLPSRASAGRPAPIGCATAASPTQAACGPAAPRRILIQAASLALSLALAACGGGGGATAAADGPAEPTPTLAKPSIATPSPLRFTGSMADGPLALTNSGGDVESCRVDSSNGMPGLPDGLSLTLGENGGAMSCQISGTPTPAATPGTVELTIVAANAAGSVRIPVAITIEQAAILMPPSLAGASGTVTLTVDQEITPIQIANSGGPVDPGGCGITGANQLPAGLGIGERTVQGATSCQITGIPSATADATAITVAATNNSGRSTATVTIEVIPPAPLLADISETLALTVDQEITPIQIANSGGPVDPGGCGITGANQLPAGLGIGEHTVQGATSCQITGAPSAPAAPAAITVTASNAAGSSTATVTIEVIPPAPLLADISETASLTVDQEITPIGFTNSGGPVEPGGCGVTGANPMPAGLSIGEHTVQGTTSCQITGTPSGLIPATAIIVTAANAAGSSTASVTIEVATSAPALTGIPATVSLTVNQRAAPIAFTNGGGPVEPGGCGVTGANPLPAGLAIGEHPVQGTMSCQITGAPSALAAPAAIAVTASNAAGSSTATVTIEVISPAPALSVAATASLTVNQEIAPIEFTNGGGPVEPGGCSVTGANPLPAGLAIGERTIQGTTSCQITGTPSSLAAATAITVTAANAAGSSTATLTIEILEQAPILADLPGAVTLTVNQEIAPIAFANSGGPVEPGGCSVTGANPLPAGLSIGEHTAQGTTSCQITGTPSSLAAATAITVTAANAGGSSTATVTIEVRPSAPVLSDISGTVALTVNQEIPAIQFTNSGGPVDPGGCSVSGQAPLPAGLAIGEHTIQGTMSCQITGIPSAITPATSIAISAANATATATATVTIEVVQPPPQLDSIVDPQIFPAGQAIAPIQFTNTGGSVAVGGCGLSPQTTLPQGLSLARQTVGDRASCQIEGIPAIFTAAANYTIIASNIAGATTATVTIAITPPLPQLQVPEGEQEFVLMDTVNIVLNNAGGGLLNSPTATPAGCSVQPSLPEGLAIERSTDGNTCRITGQASQVVPSIIYTITATNLGGSSSAEIPLAVFPDELSRAVDFHAAFTSSGIGEWSVLSGDSARHTSDGVDSAKSAPVGLNQASCVSFTVNQPGKISFRWRIESAAVSHLNRMVYYIDDVLQRYISGKLPWSILEAEVDAPGGADTALKWCYTREVRQSEAGDGAHLDQLSYIPTPIRFSAHMVSATEVALSWSAYPGATHYRLYRSQGDDPAAATELTAPSGATTTTYSDPGLSLGTRYHYWISACTAPNECTALTHPAIVTSRMADADADGLIEINTLTELDHMRHNLSGSELRQYIHGSNGLGCPSSGCLGYELMADLDFDINGNGYSWTDNGDGSYTLDPGDAAPYFDPSLGGWLPIGDCGVDSRCSVAASNRPFIAIFEGNGYTISNLASQRAKRQLGFFGLVGVGGQIRNVGLVNSLFRPTAYVDASVGGLVGHNDRGIFATSYVTGRIIHDYGGRGIMGGFVGSSYLGSVTACHFSGTAKSGSSSFDWVGGFAGGSTRTNFTSSYALADVDGGGGSSDTVGGFVGYSSSGLQTATYAVGTVDGGSGNDDSVGQLVGSNTGALISITSSWGFGSLAGTDPEYSSSIHSTTDLPPGATAPQLLTIGASPPANTNVPQVWNSAANLTLGAWHFGTDLHYPALTYADYDGPTITDPISGQVTSGGVFHCANDAANAPEGAVLIHNCATPAQLIPHQRPVQPVAALRYSQAPVGDGQPARYILEWEGAVNAVDYRVWRSASADPSAAVELTSEPIAETSFTDESAIGGASYHYWIQACSTDSCVGLGSAFTAVLRVVDSDNDGLIEIATLAELDNIRYSLSGEFYRAGAAGGENAIGCPEAACRGYELVASLDFDGDDDDSSAWMDDGDGGYSLDADDNADWFDASSGGWIPIGADPDNRFEAIFDGNGHTIANLATSAASGAAIGLFGFLGPGGEVRNLGLIDNLAARTGSGAASVGGIAGHSRGNITASYATGRAHASTSNASRVGGLVGTQAAGAIHSCFAIGDASVGTIDEGTAGGLVGEAASGDEGTAGGLVGEAASGASITASYAMGRASGSAAANERVGGLVGLNSGASITASYASVVVDGGAGSDYVGALVGSRASGTLTASWGFGFATAENAGYSDGSDDRPSEAVFSASLSIGASADTDVPGLWNEAASTTLGAWDLGTEEQTPALLYADYDGPTMMDDDGLIAGDAFHCANDAGNAPDGAILVYGCAVSVADARIANQRLPFAVTQAGLSYEALSAGSQEGRLTLSWTAGFNADSFRIWRGSTDDPAMAAELTTMPITAKSFVDSGALDGNQIHYWIEGCRGQRCSGFAPQPFSTLARIADGDDDGLIDIATLAGLNSMRRDLEGKRYFLEDGSIGAIIGCPIGGCFGYELMNDLDFDGDDEDTTTWTDDGNGGFLLDGDDDADWFDSSAGGWAPIGASAAAAFTAAFDGNGHTIANLATTTASGAAIGLFGFLGEGAVVRNLGLIDNLAMRAGGGAYRVGGIAGHNLGTILASYTTGRVHASASAASRVGGLVGIHAGEAIHACFSAADASVSNAELSAVGGLVGEAQSGASITASYAMGRASGSAMANELVGGLVGLNSGASITASYAMGAVDGAGGSDYVGALVGQHASGTATASWGFGLAPAERSGYLSGSNDRPSGADHPWLLTIGAGANTDVPASWNEAASATLGAWDLGTATQIPVLLYADYDGPATTDGSGVISGDAFHCANDAGNAPDGAILVHSCASVMIANQRLPLAVAQAGLSYEEPSAGSQEGRLTLSWTAGFNADGFRVWRGSTDDPAMAAELTSTPITALEFTDSAATEGAEVHYWIQGCSGQACSRFALQPFSTLALLADGDSDGLIDIATLADLNNIRHDLSGAGHRTEAGGVASTIGCPPSGCFGYELMNDLDFDGDDEDTTAWTVGSGVFTLDGDDDAGWFDSSAGGWAPIGATSATPFTAIFDGNGRTIANLATTATSGAAIGLFGFLGAGGEVRNLGLIDNLAARSGFGAGSIGGLVGHSHGNITASYTTGRAHASTDDASRTGGLVGTQAAGAIRACFAIGDVGTATESRRGIAGGLVGQAGAGASITASYAAARVIGSATLNERVGGLVGYTAGGGITASYAMGAVDGGGGSDYVGALVGHHASSTLTASWGFGPAVAENGDYSDGSTDRPSGAIHPELLTIGAGTNTDVPSLWNEAASSTLGAWDLGTVTQTPALLYADYDGPTTTDGSGVINGGDAFHCANDAGNAPDDAILVYGCASAVADAVIANQRAPHLVTRAGLGYEAPSAGSQEGRLTLGWLASLNADGFRVWRGSTNDPAMAAELTSMPISALEFTDNSVAEGAEVHYWIQACSGLRCSGFAPQPFSTLAFPADGDGDGLIDIATLADLNNIRHDLSGARYRSEAGSLGSIIGCPPSGCFGYELMNDLDFDGDDEDTTTWTVNNIGNYSLDTDDNADWFDTSSWGWSPIGAVAAPAFTAVFDGNGHTIANLATIAASGSAIGLFGFLGEGGEVRNLGLIDNLAVRSGSGADSIGGIVGHSRGNITASYTTGRAHSSTTSAGRAGGLVGTQAAGAIRACFAIGDVRTSDDSGWGVAGGLVGEAGAGASIAASYAAARVIGSAAHNERVGGLVGLATGGGITDSYAMGAVDGGEGNDYVGALVGQHASGPLTSSWGFGLARAERPGYLSGSNDRPSGADHPWLLTIGAGANTDVPASWNEAASATLGAWDLGTAIQTPALVYADYDGPTTMGGSGAISGDAFHCANDASNAPEGATLIHGCADPAALIPRQRLPESVDAATIVYTEAAMVGEMGENAITWAAAVNADRYRVFRGTTTDPSVASELTMPSTPHTATTFTDSEVTDGTDYNYWIVACRGQACSGFGMAIATE